MPLLNDALAVYAGQAPALAVYAGAELVWAPGGSYDGSSTFDIGNEGWLASHGSGASGAAPWADGMIAARADGNPEEAQSALSFESPPFTIEAQSLISVTGHVLYDGGLYGDRDPSVIAVAIMNMSGGLVWEQVRPVAAGSSVDWPLALAPFPIEAGTYKYVITKPTSAALPGESVTRTLYLDAMSYAVAVPVPQTEASWLFTNDADGWASFSDGIVTDPALWVSAYGGAIQEALTGSGVDSALAFNLAEDRVPVGAPALGDLSVELRIVIRCGTAGVVTGSIVFNDGTSNSLSSQNVLGGVNITLSWPGRNMPSGGPGNQWLNRITIDVFGISQDTHVQLIEVQLIDEATGSPVMVNP